MNESIQIRYLIANEQDATWGLTVNTVGYQQIEPNSIYPPQIHPEQYFFSIQKGRILDECILLYITQGKGTFVSSSQKIIELKSGDMVLLFPGEWHSYSPDKSTGWREYWIGFKGIDMESRIENGFFCKLKPIFNVGSSEEIVQLYMRAISSAKKQEIGFQQILAGIVTYLLGIAYSRNKLLSFEDVKVTNQIDKAKMIMFENSHTNITPEDIANQICVSYSSFRRIFKQYTGLSPLQYIQEIRIQKGKDLLANTLLTSQEIAFRIGYENPDYFCAIFKKKTGYSPIKYREFIQGKNL
ncbi:helix-turn-helix domain-containing protein [Dysgonomonas sp. ZJ279]|uniref:helix-turn-helix domain-containing protein n=1 Tax=Dysgonomonas sp. ZJ279 TaxID=2709796 RepID=UPI0013EBE271|nr:helix-turn-helix domain-containing protein [Dysgonomonas sp. ZJ279]